MTTPTYCSTEDLKYELGSYEMSDDGRDDAKFDVAIAAASRQIDNWCGQRFWQDPTAVARTFATGDGNLLTFPAEGIADASTVIVKLDTNDVGTYDTTLSTTDFILHPTNAAVMVPAQPFTSLRMTGTTYNFRCSSYGRDLVQVTAKWGWPAVPDEVTKACLIQAADLFKSKDAAFGVAGGNEFGALRVASGLNRMAESLLWPYRVVVGIA